MNLVFVVAAAVVMEAEEAHMSSHATGRGAEGPSLMLHRMIPRYSFTFVYLP